MAQVKTLGKGEKNEFDNYQFTSIDAFLAAVNPLCAQAGLVIFQNEVEASIIEKTNKRGEPSPWLWATFEFTLADTKGSMYGPIKRSVMVQANGAQAFGSAQSYALKQFMRSLFQIPTGDKDDADHRAAEELPKTSNEIVTGRLNKTALQKALREFDTDLHSCTDADQLNALIQTSKPILEQCERDMPSWYFGKEGSDIKGLQDRIAEQTAELNKVDLMP